MNRWRRWAQQTRRRHGRRELGRTGSMVLVSRPRFVAQMLFAGRQTVVHLDVHIPVTHRPSLQMCGGRVITHTLSSIGMALQRRSVAPSVPMQTKEGAAREGGSGVHGGAAFVHRMPSAAGAPHGADRTRTPAALQKLVMQWRDASPHRVLARGAVARLRERAVRAELPVLAGARVLARHTPEKSVSTLPRQAIEREESAPSRREWNTVIAPAPAVVNVDALTSQVIQQLDRRLVAYRERMGRV